MRRRFRFSLRTLLIAVLLIGSAMTLWWHWEPWHIIAFLPCGEESLEAAAISPDGAKIATLSDSHLRIWNAATGRLARTLSAQGKTGYYRVLEFSPDSKWAVSKFTEKDTAKSFFELWDTDSGNGGTRLKSDRAPSTDKFSFSYDGLQILDRYQLCKWDIASGKQVLCVTNNTGSFFGSFPPPTSEEAEKIEAANTLQVFAEHVKPFLVRCTVSGDRRIAATNLLDFSKTQVWNLVDDKKLCEITATDWDSRLSDDGRWLATWSEGEKTYRIWDTGTGTLLSKCPGWHGPDRLRRFSPAGDLFACAGKDDMLRVWETRTGTLKFSSPVNISEDASSYNRCEFFPDGTCLAHRSFETGSTTADVLQLRDTTNGTLLATLRGRPEDLNGTWLYCISPDGTQIVTSYHIEGSEDGCALWNRRRPEWWWGLAWLPEFWVALALAGGFTWSVRRDWGELKRKAVP